MVGVVGLTGGIASGKSVVANFFSELGVPIIDADVIAHDVIKTDSPTYHTLLSHFGHDILSYDRSIDRKKLRALVFDNVQERQWLEALLHPMIRETIQHEIKKVKTPYCICVIPLLVESTGIDFIDRVLVVHAPLEAQIARAARRDNTDENQIKKIIAAQTNQEKRLAIAHDVIDNTNDLLSLKNKVKSLHQQYLTRYQQNAKSNK